MSRIEPCTELPVWFRAYSDSALEEFQLADISAANSERKLMDACRGEAQPQRHSEWLVWFRAYMVTSRFSAEEFQLADISSADSKRKLIDACRGQAEVVSTSRLSSRCSILRCAIPWSYKEAMHFCNQHGVTAEEVALTPRSGDAGPSAASADGPSSQVPARIGSVPSTTMRPATATPRGTMDPSASSANELASAASAGAHREAPSLNPKSITLTSPKEWPQTDSEWPSMAAMKVASMLPYLPVLKKLESDSLGRILGEGKIGRVFESQRRGVPVALKVIDFSTDTWKQSSAVKEVLAFSKLPLHHNVIELMDVEAAGPCTIILVLPLFDRTLADRQGRKVTPEELLFIADSLVAGLHHLHSNGFIHGDLKPRNIFVKGAPYPENGVELLSWSSFASAVATFDQTICLADLDAVEAVDPAMRARISNSDFFLFARLAHVVSVLGCKDSWSVWAPNAASP